MNPAAHQRLWPSVHVETNLAFHFRRGNALDFQRTVLRFGELVPGLLLGFGSNGLGLELGLGPYGISLGLLRLFARLDSRLTLGCDGGILCNRRAVMSVVMHRLFRVAGC